MVKNRGHGADPLMWVDFKKTFQDKYYPQTYCDERRYEFLRLEQGDMVVAEYKKFTELGKYTLALIVDEVHKCKRFAAGLQLKFVL